MNTSGPNSYYYDPVTDPYVATHVGQPTAPVSPAAKRFELGWWRM